MKTIKFKKTYFLCMLSLLFAWLSNDSFAVTNQQHKSTATKHQQKTRLQQINKSIVSLKQNILLSETEKEKVQQQLQATENTIGTISQKLRKTNSNLSETQSALKRNLVKQLQLTTQLSKQKRQLNQYIRSAYILGRQPYVKVLLNQQNPANMNRYLHYYNSLLQAHWLVLQQMQNTLLQLQEVEAATRQQSQQLMQLKLSQQQQSSSLQTQKIKRKTILQQLNSGIISKKQQLQKLIADKERLQNLLAQVEKQSSPYVPASGIAVSGHGNLNWPIDSRQLAQQFNQPLVDGRLRSTGILIKANPGTVIHSVLPGKVVFAQWLRGYGLLVILQHGNGLMTLYAHAESINVTVGQIVKAGDTIGTVGNSGGFEQNGLYFEVRRGSQPLNPLAWLKK